MKLRNGLTVVMTRASPLRATSSIRPRQRALNWLALICQTMALLP
ncbi:hypothetical protein [Cyanobium sp. BA20m-14]|nr:hypothetical protein [Cyanobium sp. BA20m-14]